MSAMSHVDKHYTAKLVLLYLFTVNCQLHKENVALSGTCSMTTKYPNTGDCTELIDNVTDLDLRFTNDGGIANCIHTANTNPAGCFPFWQLVLNEDFTITNITIYSRAGFPQRLTYTDVTVNGTLCKSFGSDVSSIVQNDVATFQCSSPIRGRTVKISRNSNCSGVGEFTLNLCEVQVWVCSKGWFGNDCNTPCSGHCSNKATCDRYNGSCPTDCINGWYGSRCDNSCQNCVGACVQSSGVCSACQFGWFGNDCNTPCSGHCNSNVTCNQLDGTCPQGCQIGWYGSSCNNSCPKNCDSACNQSSGACFACKTGWYGNDCNAPCSGHCNNSETCNRRDGSCPLGCISGWYGSKCNYSCPVNCKGACNQISGACFECNGAHYGQTCQEDCGQCFLKVCNMENGHCPKCEPGWELPQCKKECNDSYYGQNCTAKCGHCSQEEICNKIDGSCLSCEPGWEPPLCVQECNESYYGQNCTAKCGHCSQGVICNKTDGSCLLCEPGWERPLCLQECNDSFYGPDCKQKCGNCSGTEPCNKMNGYCTACNAGWGGPLCMTAAVISPSPPVDTLVGAIVGGVVGAAVVIIAIVLFIFVYRRRKSRKESSNNREYPHTLSENISNIPAELDHKDHVASHGKKELVGSRTVNLKNNPPLESSGAVAHDYKDRKSHRPITIVNPQHNAIQHNNSSTQVYENVSAVNKTVKNGDVRRSLNVMLEDSNVPMDVYDDDADDVYNTEDIYSTYRPLVVWDTFQQSILSSLASDQLSVHFKNLPKGMKHPHTEGMKPENMRKNRFKSILPYDANRVILQRSKAEKDSDYINASYIKGAMKEDAYIATQGPRAHTVNDFWLMMWQQSTAQIVMLTNVKENGKDKCEEYWPAPGASRTYGNIVVTCLSEELRADFIARSFYLKLKGNPVERQVQQYHYMAWPDHGVPSATSLVDFWQYVKAQAQPSFLPVVHCSAGVGRTGTYLALDIAMDLVADSSDVNVLKIVTDMREDRTDMVQAEAQYKFLYEVIFEAYTGRNSRLTREEFDKKFPRPINVTSPNVIMDNEFKVLQLMGEFVPKQECNISSKQENIIRCRNISALPGDNHLVYLKGQNQQNTFINAVYMPSFKQRNGMLLTQLPLPDTLLDFWRLVDESDVNTIVSLSYKGESKAVKNYCQYWPKTPGDVLTVDQYLIKQVASTVVGHHLTTYSVTIQEEENVRTVHILHFTDWSGEVPGDPNDIIQLVESLNTYRSERDASPVLIQCIDGAAKSGLFCVMSDIIDRVTSDHVIDVFLSARHMQTVRPQAITSELQYRFCYKLAQVAKRHQGVYENT